MNETSAGEHRYPNPGYAWYVVVLLFLAYILSLSRYAPGDTELDYKDGALDDLTVAPRVRN